LEAASGAGTAVAAAFAGSLLGVVGGVTVAIGGLALGTLATATAMKSFAAAASPQAVSAFSQSLDILVASLGVSLVPGIALAARRCWSWRIRQNNL